MLGRTVVRALRSSTSVSLAGSAPLRIPLARTYANSQRPPQSSTSPYQPTDRKNNASKLEAKLDDIDQNIQHDIEEHLQGSLDPLSASEHTPNHPTKPLPDLTQGIPSTLEAELDGASGRTSAGGLNVTEAAESDGPRGGEIPKTAYIPSVERKKRRLFRALFAGTISGAIFATVWYGRNWDTVEEERKHPEAPSGWGIGLFYNRLRARTNLTLNYYTEPTFQKLLPDMPPELERPYTLVVALEDLLIHGEWTREHGWRVAKRPGVDYFLRYLSSYYEIVVWSSTSVAFCGPVMQKLDPYRIASWPLFKEATRYEDGEFIKVRRLISIARCIADHIPGHFLSESRPSKGHHA